MLKSFVKAGIVAGLVLPGVTYAVGFGNASVASALGQPFKADIELMEVSKAEKNNLTARLATPDAFKAAGIEYPYNLSRLKFSIETHENGEPYILVSSSDSVNDPVITLLVELSWPSGKLVREYTFLLDPPEFKAQQPSTEEVKPIVPVIAAPLPEAVSAPAAVQPVPMEAAASAPAAAPAEMAAPIATAISAPAATEVAGVQGASAPEAAQPMPVPEAAPVPAPGEVAAAPAPAPVEAAPAPVPAPAPAAVSAETIKVNRGDTLSKIAAQVKEPDITLEQMLVALYRANVKQFDGKNMNRIRAGKILRMPDQSTLETLSQTEAVKEIRIQTSNWNSYRQKLAAAAAPVKEEAPKQEAAGKVTTAVTDHAPPAKEAAKEVLKLSKGEAPGDHIAASGAAAQKQAQEEEAIAKKKAAEEASKRTAMLEKNVQDMQRLEQMKGQSAVVAVPVAPMVAPASAPAAAPASGPAAASAVRPAKPVAKKPIPVAAVPETSMVDEVIAMVTENPLYIGIAAAVAVIAGLGTVIVRKGGLDALRRRFKKGGEKKKEPERLPEEEIGATTGGHLAVPQVPSPATGDFTQTQTGPGHAAKAPETEEVDAISEADLFLNFGRDVQAEEVLKDALAKDPGNLPIQLKLLSIYANRKDLNAFTSIARKIKDSGDAAAWEQAAALGRSVDASNPMYGGAAGEAAPAAAPAPAAPAAPSVDIDVGVGVPMDFDITGGGAAAAAPAMTDFDITSRVAAAPAQTVEFDVTGSHPHAAAAGMAPAPEASSLEAMTMDFDVTGTHAPVVEQAPSFDVTGGHPELAAAPSGLDFDVTGSHPNIAAQVAPAPSGLEGLEGLTMDFDLGTSAAAPAPAAAAPALDFGTLTFDVTSPPPAQTAEAPGAGLSLGDISLSLDESVITQVAPVAEAGKDEHWHEVATKLDLAKAYYEMGDREGAREILGEVVREGDEQQKASAEALMQQL